MSSELYAFIVGALLLQICQGTTSVAIVYSDNTPPELEERVRAAQFPSVEVVQDFFSPALTDAIRQRPPTAIIDLSYSAQPSQALRLLATELHILLFVDTDWAFSFPANPWIFYLNTRVQDHGEAVQRLMDALDWEPFHFASTADKLSLELMSQVQIDDFELASRAVVSALSPASVYSGLVGRQIKPTGNWKAVFVGDIEGSVKFVEAMIGAFIFTERCGVFVASRRGGATLADGVVTLTEAGLEDATDSESHIVLSIKRTLDELQSLSDGFSFGTEIKAKLTALRGGVYPRSVYTIVNVVNGVNQPVGLIENGSLTWGEAIVYPGGATEISTAAPKIRFSANDVVYPFDNERLVFPRYFQELASMIDYVNADATLLENFELELQIAGCGRTEFDYEFMKNCWAQNYPDLGVVYLHAPETPGIEGTLQVMREDNFSLPHVLSGTRGYTDVDMALYPNLVETTPPFYDIMSILPRAFTGFGWDEVVYIGSLDGDSLEHTIFAQVCEEVGIKILNNEEHRLLPNNYTMTDFEKYREMFEAIKNTNARIIVNSAEFPMFLYVSQSLYEVGLRKEDVVIVYTTIFSVPVESGAADIDQEKVKSISDGSLSFYYSLFHGEFGDHLKEYLSDKMNIDGDFLRCYITDSTLLAAYAVDECLTLGKNFEDPDTLLKFLLSQKIASCSGPLSISPETRIRSQSMFTINNYFYNETLEAWEEQKVGYYTVGTTIPLTIEFEQIVWYDGTSDIPGDMRILPDCGFDEAETEPNAPSQWLSRFLALACLLVLLGVSALLMKQYWKNSVELLTEQCTMYFEDGLQLYLPLLEGVQYFVLILHPEKSEILITPLLRYFGRSWQEFSDPVSGFYWRLVNLALSISSAWIACFVLSVAKLTRSRFFPNFIASSVEFIGLTLIPLMSSMVFIPLVVIILSVGDCARGTSEHLTDSYLEHDCHTFCWQGSHLTYASLSFSLVLLYPGVAIFSRCRWEEQFTYTNIRSNPRFLIAKGLLQMCLILTHEYLKPVIPSAFYVFSVVCFGCYLLAASRGRPTNYSRLNMWIRMTLIVVLTACLVEFLNSLVAFAHSGVFLMMHGGAAVIGAVTAVVLQLKKYPSLIVRKKKNNLIKLFLFQFGKVSEKELTPHELDHYVDRYNCKEKEPDGQVE